MLDALRYPLRGDRPLRRLVVGSLLSALGPLGLPAVLVAGYYGRVLAHSADGEAQPPSFGAPRALFAHGVRTWLVVALYAALGFAVVTLLLLAARLLGLFGTGAGAVVGLLAAVVAGLVLLGLVLGPTWFFLPVALTRVARTGSLGPGLDLGTIGRIAIRREYLGPWLAGLVVLGAGTAVYVGLGGPVRLPPVLSGVAAVERSGGLGAALAVHAAGVVVNFYGQVVAFHLFGRGYRASLDGLCGDGPAGTVERSRDAARRVDERPWGVEARAWRERRRRERERHGSEREPAGSESDRST